MPIASGKDGLKKIGWGGRIRTSECRYQKPVPYHLATPQQCVGRPYSGPVVKGNRSIEPHNPIMGVDCTSPLNSDQTLFQALRHLARAARANSKAA